MNKLSLLIVGILFMSVASAALPYVQLGNGADINGTIVYNTTYINITGGGGSSFDQSLNTTDNVTFANVNAGNICYSNGTNCQASSGNPFDQDLNTTNNVTFANVSADNFFGNINWSWIINAPNFLLNLIGHNVSELNNDNGYYNSSTLPSESDPIYTAQNSTIVRAGSYDCQAGQALVNTTINSSGIWGQCATVSGTETDPLWTANYTLYNSTWSSTYNSTYNLWAYNQTTPAINTILGFSYYNSTTIPAYALLSTILGFNYYNSTNLPAETDPKWTGNSTLVPYLANNNTFTGTNNTFNGITNKGSLTQTGTATLTNGMTMTGNITSTGTTCIIGSSGSRLCIS